MEQDFYSSNKVFHKIENENLFESNSQISTKNLACVYI